MRQSQRKFMQRAFELARKGQKAASPNPMVGAVFVKNGRIIAEGFHKICGGPHAEINAINSIKDKSRLAGSDLYINLEPCAHFSKTPPCVREIVKRRPAKVVVAMKDPNPAVCGRGIRALKKAGIRVEIGLLRKEARRLNAEFVKRMAKNRPFVALKIAASLDGRIAANAGDSKWISSEQSRHYVKKLRNSFDAVLVGINTVLKDNPRLAGFVREPKRIVLDSHLRTPLNSKVLRDSNAVIAAVEGIADKRKIAILKKRGIEVKIFKKKIIIPPLLRFLVQKGISSLLVEGGAKVFGSFIDAKAVDRFYWFIAPKIIGGKGKNAIEGAGAAKIRQAVNLRKMSVGRIGPDIYIECEPNFSPSGKCE